MDKLFQESTKNNGLKKVEWGSEEFIKKLQQQEQQRLKQEEMQRHYEAVMTIKGY